MSRYVGTGREQIRFLQFLSTSVRELNHNALTEEAALKVWPHFLADDALEAFCPEAEDGEDALGGFSAWPGAV